MNAFRIDIWRSVEHNGRFITNNSRVVFIHARNKKEAESKITLAKGRTYNSNPQLVIKVSDEIIYSTEKIGTVTIQPFYVYSDGHSPVLVSQYKADLKKSMQEAKR